MADDFKSINHRIFKFETTKKEHILMTPSSSSFSPLYDIKLKVLLENKRTQWIRSRDSRSCYFAGECKVLEYNVGISLFSFLSEEETCERIEQELRRGGGEVLSEDECNRFVKYAWKQGWESIKSRPVAAFTTLNLEFQLVLEQRSVGECEAGCVVEPLLASSKEY